MVADTAARAAPKSASSRAWLGWTIQILCLCYAALVIAQNVETGLWDAGVSLDQGTLGASFDLTKLSGGIATVTSTEPGGAMAGAAPGDRVRFDRPYDYGRPMRAGETVSFTLDHLGRTSRHHVTAEAAKPVQLMGSVQLRLLYYTATTMAAMFGALIIWRSRRQATPLLLGMGLLTYGLLFNSPQFWLPAPAVYTAFYVLGMANIAVIPILFYAFAMRFYGDCVGPVRTWEWAAFWIYALVQSLVWALVAIQGYFAVQFIGLEPISFVPVSYLGYLVCLAYLFVGWRRSGTGVQQRYALMLVATSAIILAQAFDNLVLSPSDIIAAIRQVANSILTGVIASGLLTYAILRRKVFDVGFAVNRTLIYGVVSAVLLAAFGLIEWAVEHFIPIRGHEENALLDAGIAVGVFLTFHRVRDVVEHVIEHLFFRRWQKAEAELRKFVREAAFVTHAQALTQAFARALAAYAEDAEAAVYLAEGGGYLRAEGKFTGAPNRLDPNLPALVSLRADAKPMEIQEETLGAAVIAPMVKRNEVIGVVLLGPKPNGLDFRPDEIELIGWATRQVGLDLHALRMERLEADKADLHNMVAMLRNEVATLRSVIPQAGVNPAGEGPLRVEAV
jgi:hypothetical protein